MTANTSYPIDPALSAIAVAYSNPASLYIADQVLPRAPVMREEYKVWTFPVEESFRVPDSTIGRRGRANEVTLTATETIAATSDYALADVIPFPDQQQAQPGVVPAGFNPLDHATMQLTDYILLGREKRVADLVFAAASYPSGFKTQLSSNDQWDVYDHDDSNPIEDLLTGLDAMLLPATHLILGQAVWLKFRCHPMIVAAIHGNDGTVGIVTRRQVAELFELSGGVLVGAARLNTAAYGQTAVLERAWGNHALLAHINPAPSIQARTLTFGLTAQYGSRVTTSRFLPEIGLRGATEVKVGESVNEHIIAGRAAYFIEDAI